MESILLIIVFFFGNEDLNQSIGDFIKFVSCNSKYGFKERPAWKSLEAFLFRWYECAPVKGIPINRIASDNIN